MNNSSLDYVKGECKSVEDWDIDEINSIEVGKLVKSLGYPSFKCLWYRNPVLGLFNGRRPFNNDEDVVAFLNDVKGHDEVDIYVEHWAEAVEVINEKACEVIEERELSVEIISENVCGEAVVESALKDLGIDVEPNEDELIELEKRGEGGEHGLVDVVVNQEQSHDAEDLEQEVFVDVVQGQSNGGEVSMYDGLEDLVPYDSEADSLDEEFNPQDEEEVESEVESLDDSDYDEGWDWSTVLPPLNPQVHGSSLVNYEEAGTDTVRTFFL